MCGILGIIQKEKIDKSIFSEMLKTISHRGLDDEGAWFSESEDIALGHRRLSIIDLSKAGRQPMFCADKRFAIIFNGEIYNFQEVKEELIKNGYKFFSASDTEVCLNAYIEWGKECLQKFNGMFSFAIWDDKEKKLFAARDRMGEKPFKYYFDGEKFIFASEIKAILAAGVKKEIDWQAVDIALGFRFIPAPATGFKNIFKLPAGHFLIWQANELKIEKYWDAGGREADKRKKMADWKKEIWDLFLDSVKKRMVSDVPVGAFLSGGLDSTSVVAAMSEISEKPVDTFVISFDENNEDRKHAKIAANYFKTNHHEIKIEEIDFEAALKKVVDFYDEPFFDQSALPSLLIGEHIKKHVPVVLGGDGGDELFGGYDNYKFAKFLDNYQKLPRFVYSKLIPFISGFSENFLYKAEILGKDFYFAYVDYFSTWKSSLPKSNKYLTKDDLYLPELKTRIDMDSSAKLMRKWFSGNGEIANRAMLADIRGRLADGYLTKIDIATMANTVEARAPFLDHRLVELSQTVPGRLKIKNGEEKYIWKEILREKIPAEILNRKKIGFSLPLDLILKKQLKGAVEKNILSEESEIAKVFSVSAIRKLWQDHLDSKADYSNHLWSLLILELWIKKYIKN